ncbi:hypothetical protein C8F04DRAFT_1146043 [Mycena alexandri]|uniref:Uncharacterized protein n=1 Tax=Mycena alexandri TaxID=1745969 RepID=A0AAD6WML3_9AGAR|nr:hypothetical protein C8F04DRAFT_1146043 [Mycena alexandri]
MHPASSWSKPVPWCVFLPGFRNLRAGSTGARNGLKSSLPPRTSNVPLHCLLNRWTAPSSHGLGAAASTTRTSLAPPFATGHGSPGSLPGGTRMPSNSLGEGLARIPTIHLLLARAVCAQVLFGLLVVLPRVARNHFKILAPAPQAASRASECLAVVGTPQCASPHFTHRHCLGPQAPRQRSLT